MRTFKCFDCGHTWQLPFGQGGMGSGLSCPECESRNIHRAPEDRGWARLRQTEYQFMGEGFIRGRGYGRGGGSGRGQRRRGNWNR
jgi:DNA-directed RNA polymerase subunit RPC12/RpoP